MWVQKGCFFWIFQSSMVQSIERFMKQAIVDKDPSVSSAALTSALVSPGILSLQSPEEAPNSFFG